MARFDHLKGVFGLLPTPYQDDLEIYTPACEIADLLAQVMELLWAGDEEAARDLHCRLLPLILRENHPFMRYILKRRGVFTSTVERAPAGKLALDADDRREITRLIQAIEKDVQIYPFGEE